MFSHPRLCGSKLAPLSLTFTALALLLMLAATATGLSAQTFSVLHTFSAWSAGSEPTAGLTPDRAGNFYGTTSYGGAYGDGTVFKLTHSGSGWILSTLYSFAGGADGSLPNAGVVFGPDGALYGTTSEGGQQGLGTVFSLRPPNHPCPSISCPWTKTTIYTFRDASEGNSPGFGNLVFDAAGNIYGTTFFGGGGADCEYDNCGVVFQLVHSGGTWTENVLYDFTYNGDTGSNPDSGVILDSAGNVYGTTLLGGGYGEGAVYELVKSGSSWTATALHDFGATGDGVAPFGGLTMDLQGNLYGSTGEGPNGSNGGTVFELQPSGGSWNYSILAAIPGNSGPTGTLTLDAAGNLYGVTGGDGGDYLLGNVFKLAPSHGSWIYTDLFDFNGTNGEFPYGNVVLDANGNLFGTTSQTNTAGGEVWEITP